MTSRVSIEVQGAKALIDQAKLSPKRVARVFRLASNSAMRSLAPKIRKAIVAEFGLKRSSIKNRVVYRAATAKGEGRQSYARVWVGLNPMPVSQYAFGRLKEDKTGAFANERYFPEGFIADYGAKRAIYRRFGPNDPDIEVEEVALNTPALRERIELATENAGEKYVDELVRLAAVEWDKIAKQTKKKSA